MKKKCFILKNVKFISTVDLMSFLFLNVIYLRQSFSALGHPTLKFEEN